MRTRPTLLAALLAALAAVPSVHAQGAGPRTLAPAPAKAPSAAVTTVTTVTTVAPTASPDVAIKDVAAPSSVSKSKGASGSDTLSVDFPEEEIRNILRNVADLFELNLVIPETLQGKTSVKLHDVTWRQIFQVVLAPVGYTYIEDGNIIKIVSNESLQQEPVSTEVFIINYAKASDIQPTIASLVDGGAGGKIVVDGRSNSLVITERPSRMNRIRPIIEQLDRATDQVMIESKFVEISNNDVKNIGVNWSSLAAYNVTATPGGSGLYNYTNTYGAATTGGYNNTAGTTGASTNTNGSTISSGSNTASTQTSTNGVPTSTSTTGTTASLANTLGSTLTNGTSTAYNLLSTLTNSGTTANSISAVFSADQFKLVLSALQSLNNSKIISNPTIVTLNNVEASINVGQQYPIPNYTFNQQTGTFEVSGFTYKDIGIILKVTPQVNPRGFIKLTLAPEVSQNQGTTTFGGASGASIPIIGTRKATTQVSLKDGFTMGIGGLISSNLNKTSSAIPFLGSIPVLGYLFKSNGTNNVADNLIIFITAKTISAEGAPIEQIFDSRQLREIGLRRTDLPGYRDTSSPFIEDTPAPKKK